MTACYSLPQACYSLPQACHSLPQACHSLPQACHRPPNKLDDQPTAAACLPACLPGLLACPSTASQRSSSCYGRSCDLLVRVSFKIANCSPDQLPPGMQDRLMDLLSWADATLVQGFLRPGVCV